MVLKKAGALEPPFGESPNMSSLDAFGDVLGDCSAFLWDLSFFLLWTRVYPSASVLEALEPLGLFEPGFLESMLLGGFLKVDLQRRCFPNDVFEMLFW